MSSWISVRKRQVRVFKPTIEENKDDVSTDLVKSMPSSSYPISVKYYISGGKLGDFIHQLSVIKYNYDNFGKKGVLYLANIGDNFSLGLERAYNDTKDIILKQDYILDYQLYNNQRVDINLSSWRDILINNTDLNLKQIYRNTYDIDWASTRWINNIENDKSFSNSILFSYSRLRHNNNINFDIINSLLDQKEIVYFICFDISEYNDFILNYKFSLPVLLCNTVMDMAIKINSCKLLIGNLSSPLALSFALHKECIGILQSKAGIDINLNTKLNLPFYITVNNHDELREALRNKLNR